MSPHIFIIFELIFDIKSPSIGRGIQNQNVHTSGSAGSAPLTTS